MDRLKKFYSRKNELCVAQFMLIAGMSGDIKDREEILEMPIGDGDLCRPKAVALQELNQDVVQNSGFYVPEYLKQYLATLRVPKYGFVYDLKIAGFEEEFGGY